MSDAIIVAIVSGVFSLAGYLFGNYKSQSKTLYRIDQLEKKQDKHNTLIERMYNVEDRIHVLENKQAVADHRIKDLEDDKKMKVTAGTIARTAVLAVSLLNVLLNAFGKNPLPFSDDEVYTAVSTVVAVAASLAAWWKNNSFTKAALKADEALALERTETAESEAVSHE